MAGKSLAQAYVDIIPKSTGMKEKLMSSAASAGPAAGSSFGRGMMGGIGQIAIGSAIGSAITSGVSSAMGAAKGLISDALGNYAQYEQLVGGVETLFGAGGKSAEEYAASVGKSVAEIQGEYSNMMQAQQTVMDNAAQAYRTAGMSSNEYMETVTAFSASLVSSLDGDTAAAAAKADMAITDMSDNANKMGTSMESVQNAYQGFAKQNYTMLDNLKLGYGGTKSEMERLMKDAEKIKASQGEMVSYSIDNYADMVDAIHVVQENMGITGTTANEASSTIEGSVNSAKAAWQNWMTGLGDSNADMAKLTDELVTSVSTAAQNIVPRVMQIVTSLSDTLSTTLPGIVSSASEMLTETLPEILPGLVSAVTGIVTSLAGVLPDLIPVLLEGALQLFLALVQALPEVLPALVDASVAAINSVAGMLPTLIPALLSAAVQLFMALVIAVPQILGALGNAVDSLLDSFFTWIGDGAMGLMEAAGNLMQGLLDGIVGFVGSIAAGVGQVKDTIVGFFSNAGSWLLDSGKKIVQGLIDGIKSMISGAGEAIGGVLGSIADFLPHSPAKKGPFAGRGWSLYSGMAITDALAEGIMVRKGVAASAMGAVMGSVSGAAAFGGMAVAGAGQGVFHSVGDVHITVNATGDADEIAAATAREVQRAIRMGV